MSRSEIPTQHTQLLGALACALLASACAFLTPKKPAVQKVDGDWSSPLTELRPIDANGAPTGEEVICSAADNASGGYHAKPL